VVRGGGFKWEILRAVGRVALPASWNQLFVFFAGFVVKWFPEPAMTADSVHHEAREEHEEK